MLLRAVIFLALFASSAAWAAPAIELTVTIGVDVGDVCATTDSVEVGPGAAVRLCYEIENTGDVTLTHHDLDDTVLGTILTDFPYSLAAGASAFITQPTTVTETTVFTGTWVATAGAQIASDADAAVAIVPEAGGAGTAAAAVAALAGCAARRRRGAAHGREFDAR
jgi:hypothetical protein